MNKASLKKTVSAVVVATIITTLSPLGVSAQWRENTDSTWNYIEGNEIIQGWKKISEKWYYFNLDGKMNTGWICDKGIWYYNNNSGIMQTSWVYYNGMWYYLDDSGAMRIGWIQDNDQWYYADNTGVVQTTSLSKSLDNTVDVDSLPKLPQSYSISVQADAENKILELMNQKRTEAGLQSLNMDNTLLQIARYKSNHMIQYDYFDHTTPEGEKWTSWLNVIDYKYTATGENIAYNTYNAVELFNQWWKSPGHRANMMNASYNRVGIGIINGNGKYMGTQDFSN